MRKKRAALLPQGPIPSSAMPSAKRADAVHQPGHQAALRGHAGYSNIAGGVKRSRPSPLHDLPRQRRQQDFAEPKVLAYLEEQIASSRNYQLPASPSPKATDPLATRANPGAVAMPEFWHMWGATATPDAVRKPAALGRITTVANTVGKQAKVTVDGQPLAVFAYVPDPKKPEHAASATLDQRTRDLVVAELLKAWIGYGSRGKPSNGRVKVTLAEKPG